MNTIVTFVLLTIVLLVSMYTFVLIYSNTQSKTETPPVLTLPTQTTESTEVKPILESDDIGTGALPVYQNDAFIWFKPIHEKDGCNTLTYLDKATNKYISSTISACSTVDFTDTTPLYVEYCGSGITTCFNFQQLYAYNLNTGNQILLLDASTVLGPRETLVASCTDGNFEQLCQADIQTTDNTLTIGVFNKVYTPQQYNGKTDLQQPVSFNHQKVRDITINFRELTSEIFD